MRVHIHTRNIYGKTLFYPRCLKAKIFARISGRKTLTEETLQLVKLLGFEIVEVE